MLETCEKYMEAKGIAKSIQLHVRLGDEAATELYSRFGYETIQKDSFMVKLRGITPRALLRKLIR